MHACTTPTPLSSSLRRTGYIKEMALGAPFSGIVLSPFGKDVVSPADKHIVDDKGISVIDCSWARLDEVPMAKLKRGSHRLLPFLVATNSVNYGESGEIGVITMCDTDVCVIGLKGSL